MLSPCKPRAAFEGWTGIWHRVLHSRPVSALTRHFLNSICFMPTGVAPHWLVGSHMAHVTQSLLAQLRLS